ncbi:MAG: hypothetical protein ABI348_06990 [Nitrososphaera sp.]
MAVAMAGLLAVTFSAVWLSLATTASAQEAGQTTVTRDSVLLTGPRTIAAGDFIHVYDATPYHIMKGHVAMKVPCDDQNKTSVQVLIGQAPNLKPATPEFIAQLSTPGEQCLYHVDIESHVDPSNPLITDVAIKNTGAQDVQLTDTSTVFVGVDEIMPNPPGAEHEHGGASMNMTEGGSMEGMEGMMQ